MLHGERYLIELGKCLRHDKLRKFIEDTLPYYDYQQTLTFYTAVAANTPRRSSTTTLNRLGRRCASNWPTWRATPGAVRWRRRYPRAKALRRARAALPRLPANAGLVRGTRQGQEQGA